MELISPCLTPTSDQFPNLPEGCCIVLIGMAGAGKSTLGRRMAQDLGWASLDTDNLIEAHYGVSLQHIADATTKEEFLDLEAQVIKKLRLSRTVISTGGSVVYRPAAMEHLQALGPLVHLDVDLEVILQRIAAHPERGLAIAPGQTVEDLFRERETLYLHYATLSRNITHMLPPECSRHFIEALRQL